MGRWGVMGCKKGIGRGGEEEGRNFGDAGNGRARSSRYQYSCVTQVFRVGVVIVF
jgi:hypothetical protein